MGYVNAIEVDQEDDRDKIVFRLRIHTSGGTKMAQFRIMLEPYTTVALAQLQLLRDALRSSWDTAFERYGTPLLVQIHFNFDTADGEDQPTYVYWLALHEGYPAETSVNTFFRDHLSTWYRDAG